MSDLFAPDGGWRVRILDLSGGAQDNITEEIGGFGTLMHANAFARRYVRDSVERCRIAGMSSKEVLEAWFAFGEDAVVVDAGESGWKSATELGDFVDTLASQEDRDWRSLDPRRDDLDLDLDEDEVVTRVRFAPAPTGNLLIGGVRVALANDLFARRTNGRMLLRLDDLDTERSRQFHADQIVQDLDWFGIGWHTSFRQSERLDLYEATIERLKRDNLLYPCFESEEELKTKQELRRRRNQPPVYDRAMLSLTARQRQDAEAGGKRPHWRFKLPDRTVEWNDLVLGARHVALSAVSDPILVRADGKPTPILASVADDVDFGTTHIIRSEDSAGSTAIQIELLQVLRGVETPIHFGHLPALSDGDDAAPRGRRAGSLALRGLRNDGIEPGAIIACMTGAKPATGEPLPLNDLAKRFDLADLADSRLDVSRMLEINRRILGGLPFSAVADRLPGGATEAFWLAVRGSLDLLKEARGWWDVVAGTIVPPVADGAHDLLLTAGSLLPPEPWDNAVWTNWITALEQATGRTSAAMLTPLRLALTGEDSGPELADLLPLMGRPRVASRLAIAAA